MELNRDGSINEDYEGGKLDASNNSFDSGMMHAHLNPEKSEVDTPNFIEGFWEVQLKKN